MSAWTCLLGWFRFTVPDSSAEEILRKVPLQVHLEIPPPFYRAGAVRRGAPPAIAGGRAARDRTILCNPFSKKIRWTRSR